jgi:hypothetical protein
MYGQADTGGDGYHERGEADDGQPQQSFYDEPNQDQGQPQPQKGANNAHGRRNDHRAQSGTRVRSVWSVALTDDGLGRVGGCVTVLPELQYRVVDLLDSSCQCPWHRFGDEVGGSGGLLAARRDGYQAEGGTQGWTAYLALHPRPDREGSRREEIIPKLTPREEQRLRAIPRPSDVGEIRLLPGRSETPGDGRLLSAGCGEGPA